MLDKDYFCFVQAVLKCSFLDSALTLVSMFENCRKQFFETREEHRVFSLNGNENSFGDPGFFASLCCLRLRQTDTDRSDLFQGTLNANAKKYHKLHS